MSRVFAILSMALILLNMGYADNQHAIAAPFRTPTPQITATPDVFALHTSTCRVSNCWDGIVSGVTTLDQAHALLVAKYGQEKVFAGSTTLTWDAQSDQLDSHTGWLSTTKDEIVLDIDIRLAKDILTAANLIEQFGEPTYVYAARARSSTELCVGASIAFPDLGVLAWVYPFDSSIGIQATQSIYLLTLASSEFVKGAGKYDTFVLEWQGYTDYCELAEAQQAKQ